MYERTLAEWLSKEDTDQAQFYKDVQYVQDTTTDPKVQEFVYCLLASCDYDSFYSVMVREAMKLNATKSVMRAPQMAEAKSDGGDGAGAKGSAKGEK